MSSGTKAFGRSLPQEMQEARAHLLQTTGQQALLEKPRQLWKVNDTAAGKNGNCQAVYWVKEKKSSGSDSGLKRQAKPEKLWDTGSVYKGEWKNNLKHGYGIQMWSNGNKYEGEWAFGNREGHGVFWLREKVPASKKDEEESKSLAKPATAPVKKLRRVYAGNWKNDLKDGTGVFFYKDGSRFEGEWSCDVRCGRGTLYQTNSDSYTGEWKNDLQNGFGTLTKANADVYEGEWLNGMREGSGIYYYKAKEKIYDGEWVNDQPKCGVYLDAKEFFDDAAEESRYTAAQGAQRAADGSQLSASAAAASLGMAARAGDPSSVSPRVPRNRGGMPIPRLRMADADGILAACIESIAVSRAPMRSLPHTSMRDLFSGSSLNALRRLFASYDSDPATGDGSGSVAAMHLPAMLVELTLPALTPTTLAQLCTDLRLKTTKDKISFQQFVQAVHISEASQNTPETQPQEEE